jgi:teichuronic acid exporter
MSYLRKQALHGAFWSFTERFGRQGVQFILSIFLARLLEPKDFGVLAMITIFTALAHSVVDSGFGQALIQKQDASHEDESTVFWFNLGAGVAMAGVMFFAAPWIALFYEMPLLKPITRVLSINLAISGLGIVQHVLLSKELLFRQRMKANLVSLVVSGLTGLFMAWKGFGVWSLVVQALVQSAVRTTGLWIVHPWRPAFVFRWHSMRVLWKFGSNMLFSGLLTTFFDNIYSVIIGKIYSASDLGFFQRGKRLVQLTSQTVSGVVSGVNFPVMSKLQDDPARMRRMFSQVLRLTLLIVVPAMTGLMVTAPNLIYVLYGEKWMATVPYLQVCCITGALYPVHLLNLDILKALGRSDMFFRLEMMKRIFTILSIVIFYRFGVLAMLWGGVACSLIALIINTTFSHRFIQYGLLRQLKDNAGTLLISAIMALGCFFAVHISDERWMALLLQISIGVLIFCGMAFVMNRESLTKLLRS